MITWRRRQDRGDEGFGAIELVLATSVLITMALLMAGLGRVAQARQQVNVAARTAARSASLELTPADAKSAGVAAGDAMLDGSGVACSAHTVSIDVSQHRPGGFDTAKVTCVADLTGLGRAGFSSHRTLTATVVIPLEQYRNER